ncbi:DUF397 domain-containing protein [Streptomyces oryzae]|uniref:DUF397 domain-containing protein n=1 Tax=Streptomyces oryzae TaxID=1434886 RepID=A0ABS3XIX0_9ACTN|nr:DUF397 domain-containing protein [Streptomyces oryzae]MBO8195319.1 DUF397 domain-containing protein [Streptomyces oryzae]
MIRASHPSLDAVVWRKSSYSNQSGGNCVEVADAAWRKSSYSNQAGGDCVEVADGVPGVVPVRDSKDPHGPVLTFPATGWAGFVGAVKGGRFH